MEKLGRKPKDKLVSPICFDKRECFARNGKRCVILTEAYDDRPCPFCKPSREDKDVQGD